jgi:hypothetical protein
MNDIENQFKALDELFESTIPNFNRIGEEVERLSPAVIAVRILEDASFSYLMDYYFHYIDVRVVKKTIQNPLFGYDALIELFYSHMISIEKAILLNRKVPELFDSYWKSLSKAEYAILFKHIIKKTSDIQIAQNLFQKLDLLHLRMMVNSGALKSENILTVFKQIGPEIKKLVVKNMGVYDFAFELAVNNSDNDYLNFLEEYTTLFVKMRLASSFVENVDKEIKEKNRNLSFQELHKICGQIPNDCLLVALEIFEDRGWVSKEEAKTIEESYNRQV